MAAVERTAVTWEGEIESLAARASALAVELGLELAAPDSSPAGHAYLLSVTVRGLELAATSAGAPGALRVDFASGRARHRRLHGQDRGSPLARAIGLRRGRPAPYVVDATAGLAIDAFVLACLGCRVLACERSAVVHALVADAIARAASDPEVAAILAARFELRLAPALSVLESLGDGDRPDVVYLDPMYPDRPGQTALAGKEMRVLREVVGDDPDAPALLEAARRIARQRVVVKRPRAAAPLAERADLSFSGKSTRHDVYLRR